MLITGAAGNAIQLSTWRPLVIIEQSNCQREDRIFSVFMKNVSLHNKLGYNMCPCLIAVFPCLIPGGYSCTIRSREATMVVPRPSPARTRRVPLATTASTATSTAMATMREKFVSMMTGRNRLGLRRSHFRIRMCRAPLPLLLHLTAFLGKI